MSHTIRYEEAKKLIDLITPLVREKLTDIIYRFPELPIKEQVKLARVDAMEAKKLTTEQMMLLWEAYDIIGSETTL